MNKRKIWIKADTGGETVYFLSKHIFPDVFAKVYPVNGKYIFTFGERTGRNGEAPKRFPFSQHEGWRSVALAKTAAMKHVIELQEQVKLNDQSPTYERN
jgi:hypothetical protein